MPAWSLTSAAATGDRHRQPAARTRRRRVGVRRRDRGRASRSASSTAASKPGHPLVGTVVGGGGDLTSTRKAGRSPTRTPRATSAGTERPAPASSARSRPAVEIYSVRVLGRGFKGSGKILLAGLRWAIEQGYDVINMSLSTTKRELGDHLHELADTAYFRRTVLVAAAHNMPVDSFPWRFSSVISVGSHEEDDSARLLREPRSAGRVLRARCRRRRRVARRRHDPRLGQQLRDAVHLRDRRADPRASIPASPRSS